VLTIEVAPQGDINIVWKMNFDGTKSQSGMGAGIVFTSTKGIISCYSLHLEFDGNNNVANYEALLLHLNLAKEFGIKVLKIIGDSDLIILQVKCLFTCKIERLKRYRNIIWGTMEWFDALSL